MLHLRFIRRYVDPRALVAAKPLESRAGTLRGYTLCPRRLRPAKFHGGAVTCRLRGRMGPEAEHADKTLCTRYCISLIYPNGLYICYSMTKSYVPRVECLAIRAGDYSRFSLFANMRIISTIIREYSRIMRIIL